MSHSLHLRRALWTGIVLTFMAATLTGCAPTPAPPPTVAPKPATAKARSRSLERAVSGLNAQTIRAWVDRYSAPINATATPAAPPRVWIDTEVLARRHAAWQLADELSRGALAPTPARVGQVTLAPAKMLESPQGAAPPIRAPGALPVRPARLLSETVSESAALNASRATLADFLDDLQARQNELETAESELARRALEDRIRAATRGAVEAIALEPVSPATALELSNLRLQLLDQIRKPAAQKAAAAARIEAIEARLNAIWEAQTAAQNARLRAALEELPARLRAEGLAALDADTARRQAERAATRVQLRRAVETRLKSAAPGAISPVEDTEILRLFLPAARVANADVGAFGNSNSSFQTKNPGVASAAADERSVALSGRALGRRDALQSAQIAALRAQARRDAKQWARQLALSWGAQLGDSNAPNRTPRALETLFGTRHTTG